jgi:hypothetical protein
MSQSNIASEWDGFSGYKVYYTKLPLTHENFELGYTEATTIVASTREWIPGLNCPDGYEFSDGSTVLATSIMSTTTKDIDELFKDDGVNKKSLKGNTKLGWHEEIRLDIDKSPDQNWYENNKWYISRSYSLEQQLADMKKQKVRKRYKKHY